MEKVGKKAISSCFFRYKKDAICAHQALKRNYVLKNLKYRLLYLLLGIALVAFAAPALTSDLWTVDTEGWTLTAKHEKAMPSTASAQAQHEDAVNVEALPTETASPLLPPDSLSRKVKKTDYPQGDRPKDYPFDLTDPENL